MPSSAERRFEPLLATTAILVPLLASFAYAGESPAPEAHSMRGERYVLYCQASREAADEYFAVLEACWPQFKAFFGAEPRLGKDEKLSVDFLATQEAWEAALRAEGTKPPVPAGGYYSPGTKRVYLFRQPTVYYTRCLLIHEAAHQFHFLSCTGNRSPKAPWYIEGVVEYLAWHWWDGKNLELAKVPLSLKDYPAAALRSLESGETDLKKMIGGDLNRPLGSQLVRYLHEGEGGKLRERWKKLARELDRGAESSKAFLAFFGNPSALQPRFFDWLKESQEPWTPVFNEWERMGDDSFVGYAKGVVSACRVKKNVGRIRATLEKPADGAWRAGLLLDFKASDDFTVALTSPDGSISVERLIGGKWSVLGRGTAGNGADPSLVEFEAVREKDSLTLRVNGSVVGTFDFQPAPMGLCLRDCSVRFVKVAWEP